MSEQSLEGPASQGTDGPVRFATPMADIRAGHELIADGGFTCIAEGTSCTVCADEDGLLYVKCSDVGGRHYLDGQDDEGHCLGFMEALNQPLTAR